MLTGVPMTRATPGNSGSIRGPAGYERRTAAQDGDLELTGIRNYRLSRDNSDFYLRKPNCKHLLAAAYHG